METLEFIATHKSFDYKNDEVIMQGSVSIGPEESFTFVGSIYEKLEEDDRRYLGNFTFRKDGYRSMISLDNVELSDAEAVIDGVEALKQKFVAEGLLIEETPEPLVEN